MATQSRLEVSVSLSDKFYVGRDITSFEDNRLSPLVSRVTLLVDDETYYSAGDDSGMEISASCPHATQEMADAILSSITGRAYHPYQAGAAALDPSAELGDGITVNGIYSVLSRFDDDGSGYPDISAPGENELEDEYPIQGPLTKELNRKLAATRSLITKTADEIRLEVQGLDERVTAVSVTLDGLTVTDESGTTKISGSSVETDTLSVKAANIDGLLSAAQIKLGGQMNVFESLDSDVSAGYFGYMDFSSSIGFSGTGLGIQSEGHAMMTANGSMLIGCIGHSYIGSVSGVVFLSGADLYWNGKSLINRIATIEAVLGGLIG